MDESSTRAASQETPGRPRAVDEPRAEICWRELRRGLWTGRSDGRPIGMIEQGRRYTFTGTDEQQHSGYRTLAEAQRAATGPIPIIPPSDAASEARPVRDPSSSRRRILLKTKLIPPAAAAGALVAGCITVVASRLLA